MNTALRILSRLGLALTIGPAFLFLVDAMSLETVKTTMMLGVALWLVSAPILQRQKQNALTNPENRDNL